MEKSVIISEQCRHYTFQQSISKRVCSFDQRPLLPCISLTFSLQVWAAFKAIQMPSPSLTKSHHSEAFLFWDLIILFWNQYSRTHFVLIHITLSFFNAFPKWIVSPVFISWIVVQCCQHNTGLFALQQLQILELTRIFLFTLLTRDLGLHLSLLNLPPPSQGRNLYALILPLCTLVPFKTYIYFYWF